MARNAVRLGIATVLAALMGIFATSGAYASTGSLYRDWGSSSFSATHGGIDWVDVSTQVNDLQFEGKCVYVEYRIDMAYTFDPDGVLGSVCGGNKSKNFAKRVGIRFLGTVRGVEFKMCLDNQWGVDPCSKQYIAG